MRTPVFILLILMFFLQACSASTPEVLPTATPTLTPTFTLTPTVTNTATVQPSPTIFKIPTTDYNATPTPPDFIYNTPTPIPGMPTMTPIPTATPSTPGEGFEWIRVSDYRLYWGSCRSNNIKISAMVTHPEDVYSVTLFVRFRRATAKIFTPWSKGLGMEPTGVKGIWAQNLYGSSIDNHALWRRGWVWYQMVAIGANQLEVGRTHIFMDMIRLEPCMCLTPPCGPGD